MRARGLEICPLALKKPGLATTQSTKTFGKHLHKKHSTLVHVLLLHEHFLELRFKVPLSSLEFFPVD